MPHNDIAKNADVWETDTAWLAGIIDGEGCLMFTPNPKSGHHLCKLQVTNTDDGILHEVQRILSEWLVPFSLSKNSAGKKLCFSVQVCRRQEIAFVLEQVEPYLKSVKKQKALAMMGYIKQRYYRSDGKASNEKEKVTCPAEEL